MGFLYRYRRQITLAALLVTSMAVYLIGYGQPRALFWDENYHIASAQKHIDGVMYMEPHPPLGKMLMAISEATLGLNSDKDKSGFSHTDYLEGSDLPDGGISFYGYRLPSALLMALSVGFLFGTLRRVTGHLGVAAAFSCLLIFDNALVIHARAAMLEGIQLFFILAAIYYAVRIITNDGPIRLTQYALLGVLIGLAISVKINGAILLLLFVMVYGADQWENIKRWRSGRLIARLFTTVPAGVLPLMAVFFALFYLHIGMGQQLPEHKDYSASDAYLADIRAGNTWAPSTFTTAMADNLDYMAGYADGVPRLDICKEGENGSLALGWPLGTKTINYRWSKRTVDGETRVRYHNLVANPVVWFSVLAGVILSAGLIISRFVYQNPVKDTALFYWIAGFTSLYVSYMLAILQIERVMYLYHYLVPLVFGIVNLALVFTYVFREALDERRRHTLVNLGGFVLLTIAVFFIFAPFTYSWELTEKQFEMRDWFDFWQLEVVR